MWHACWFCTFCTWGKIFFISQLLCCVFVCSNFLLWGQTGKAPKKRKTSPDTSDNGDEQEKLDTQPGRTFVPFNYSDVDYSTFTGKKVQENSLTHSTRIQLQ